jgi:membrane-associated phospholipid phosphatase
MTDQLIFRGGLAALVAMSFGVYGLLNRRHERVHVLISSIDRKIPFLPAFSVPYLLYLPYLFFIVIYGIMASPFWTDIAASVLVVQFAAAAVYSLHQTHVPRPKIEGGDIFSRLTAFIYRNDEPYCAFPSLHVAYSMLCCYWSFILFPAAVPLFLALTVAIIASTLFLKQHVIADVVGGASVAALSLVVGAILY